MQYNGVELTEPIYIISFRSAWSHFVASKLKLKQHGYRSIVINWSEEPNDDGISPAQITRAKLKGIGKGTYILENKFIPILPPLSFLFNGIKQRGGLLYEWCDTGDSYKLETIQEDLKFSNQP